MGIFGEYLFQLRRNRKLLQKDLASRAKLDPAYLACLESGRRQPPKPLVLDRIIRALSATESESSNLRRAAEASLFVRSIREYQEVEGIGVLVRIAEMLPYMSETDLTTFVAGVDGMLGCLLLGMSKKGQPYLPNRQT